MSNRTLFIHIPKNAGTSIPASVPVIVPREKYLDSNKIKESRMDPRSYYTLVNPQIMIKHAPYNYLDQTALRSFNRVFAVVRNPWARMVSYYHHADAISDTFAGSWYYQPKISFDEFLDRMDTFRMNSSYYWNHPYDQWGIQLDWVSKQGKVKADILRYENLQEDLNFYFDSNVKLQNKNMGLYAKHYTEYYNDQQRQKVADWFRLDIEYWGFTFESSAKRNYWTK